MARAYARHECLAPNSEDLVRIKYRRARTHYTSNQWDRAAVLFHEIATRHSEDDLAVYAANQYLDCLNAISRIDRERRDVCQNALYEGVEAFMADEALTRDEDFRQQLTMLQCGILWRRAEASIESGRFSEGAELYLGIYRDYRSDCRIIGNHGLDEVLYNAAIAYEAADRICAAIRVRERLIAEFGEGTEYARDHGSASPWARRALYQLAGNHQAIEDLPNAVRLYEEFAQRFPGEQEAPEAQRRAMELRAAGALDSPPDSVHCGGTSPTPDLGAQD